MVIIGTLMIWTIKYIIRPNCRGDEDLLFILGIAPNLLGSFLVPFGACWFFQGKDNIVARFFQVRSIPELRNVCVIGFILLVINEYLQKIRFFGRTFDYYDIIFSMIGLLVAYLVFSRKLARRVMLAA